MALNASGGDDEGECAIVAVARRVVAGGNNVAAGRALGARRSHT